MAAFRSRGRIPVSIATSNMTSADWYLPNVLGCILRQVDLEEESQEKPVGIILQLMDISHPSSKNTSDCSCRGLIRSS